MNMPFTNLPSGMPVVAAGRIRLQTGEVYPGNVTQAYRHCKRGSHFFCLQRLPRFRADPSLA